MTDEYRMFMESRRSEGSDHQDVEHSEIPRWKPPVKEEKPAKNTEFLAHHGVLGQKWGVRRYQDKDGHRIGPEKKKPKGESDESKPASEKKYNSKTLQYKAKAQTLSDEELDRRVKRMQKEAQYDMLRKTIQPKTKAERRKEIRRQIFVATMTVAAAEIVKTAYKKMAVAFIKKVSGGKINLGK